MKIAVMQPYLFPYLGYFKLINKVDKFIFLDDVSFIKKGWINRNRLIFSGKVNNFVIPLVGASQNKNINEIHIDKKNFLIKKLDTSIQQSYKKSLFFTEIYPIIKDVVWRDEEMINDIAKLSVLKVLQYLNIEKKIVSSSMIYQNNHLSGQDRIIDICLKENATEYWNLPGGVSLYSPEDFKNKNIKLSFIEPNHYSYSNFSKIIEHDLSIIDVLMHVSKKEVMDLLR